MSQLWPDKFAPTELIGFLGNSEIRDTVTKWGEAWEEGKPQKPLLLHGATGVGKTLLAYLAANHFGWTVFELSGADFRDKETIETVVASASSNSTLFGNRRLVLLDEIDALSDSDRGGAQAINKILADSKNPVILTANDIYANKKLAQLRVLSIPLEFRKINYLSIAKYLREILVKEKISFDDMAVQEIAKKCDGDMRAALLDLQTLSGSGKISFDEVAFLGERERSKKVFSVMAKIFHGKSFQEIRDSLFYSDLNHDMLVRWVEENIPLQFKENDVSMAFDYLSRADRFDGRIFSRQYYGFLRYSGDLMAYGVNQSKSREYVSFTPFRFPSLLQKLSRSIGERETKKEIAKKIGKKTHSSFRKVMAYDLPFYEQFFSDKTLGKAFFSEFGFSPHEVGFLLGAKPDSKKVMQFFEEETENTEKEKKQKKTLKEKAAKEDKKATLQKNEKEDEASAALRQTKLF